MQEKVHGTPPTIKIFEGKPPSTSWVKENIVEYYQVQSRAAFLKDVVAYMQQLQAEGLQQQKTRGALPLKEAFASEPEKGGTADIANVKIFNALQKQLKTELEYLEKFITLLKAASPELSAALNTMLTQIRQAAQAFPRLSESQIRNLSEMMDQLVKWIEKAPQATRRVFWNMQLRLLQKLMTQNRADLNDIKEELSELQGHSKVLTELEGFLQQIHQALGATPARREQFLSLIENLQHMANRFGNLNPQQQRSILSYFQQLSQFKSSKGTPLFQIAADGLVESKIADFLKQHPQATPAEIAQYLKTFLSQSNLHSAPFAFMHDLGGAIEEILSKPNFPFGKGFSGFPFVLGDEKKLKLNPELMTQLLGSLSPDKKSLQQLDSATEKVHTTLSDDLGGHQVKEMANQESLKHVKEVQNQLGKASFWAVGKSLGAGQPPSKGAAASPDESLPSQFQNAILNHYMPNQEAYLEEMAAFLYLNNMGAGFGNQLLDKMKDFSEASTYYSLNHALQPAPDSSDQDPRFIGDAGEIQKEIQQEQTQLATDMQSVQDSLNAISQQLIQIQQEIDKLPKDDPKIQHYKDMAKGLQGISDNLTVVQQQLAALKPLLNLTATAVPNSKPPEFSISGPKDWQKNLPIQEGYVISGDPSQAPSKPIGGLTKVQAQADEFQGIYSEQSQQEMMMLQMKMTEVQQEWTVVSTALQILNQVYMTVSQAIYK